MALNLKLKSFLLFHEQDIANSVEKYGDLLETFKKELKRDPSPDVPIITTDKMKEIMVDFLVKNEKKIVSNQENFSLLKDVFRYFIGIWPSR
ncbi:MAG: hypothetical protein ABIJ37_07265 [Pseudomonadota bacterium]